MRQSPETPLIITVIDDDPAFTEMMRDVLHYEGYRVITAHTASEGYARLCEQPCDLVILDIRIEHPEAGWELLTVLRNDSLLAAIPIIVASADVLFLRAHAQQVEELGCARLIKPFLLDELLQQVSRLVQTPPFSDGGTPS